MYITHIKPRLQSIKLPENLAPYAVMVVTAFVAGMCVPDDKDVEIANLKTVQGWNEERLATNNERERALQEEIAELQFSVETWKSAHADLLQNMNKTIADLRRQIPSESEECRYSIIPAYCIVALEKMRAEAAYLRSITQ